MPDDKDLKKDASKVNKESDDLVEESANANDPYEDKYEDLRGVKESKAKFKLDESSEDEKARSDEALPSEWLTYFDMINKQGPKDREDC